MSRINVFEKYAYLVGRKINKWTVLEIKNDRSHPDAICKCECGTVKPVNIRNLINNCSKDCGCGRKQMLRDTRTKNLVGKKFGKLTVLELLPDSNKFHRRQYRCLCDCGNETIVPSISLTTNHTLSCGCLNSYYNQYIKLLLDKMKIEYIDEYPIYVGGVRYRFDFYLPKYNLFIEYDGSQHFMPSRYNGSNKEKNLQDFYDVQRRDKIKNEYCKTHNHNLLRIPYYESKNIDSIISNHLQRLSDEGFIETSQ